jgi:hypothetical protein
MRGHARFEALAGALDLGEATDDERAAYDAHAASCPRCTGGALAGEVVAAIERARDDETWRPQVRAGVSTAIDRSRVRRARTTANLLVCAVVASMALNLAFAEGLPQRVAGAVRPVIARVVPFPPLVADRPSPGGVQGR